MLKILDEINLDYLVEVGLLIRVSLVRLVLFGSFFELVANLLQRFRLVAEVGQHGLARVLSCQGTGKEEVHQLVDDEIIREDVG